MRQGYMWVYLTVEIWLEALLMVCQGCYEFCELSQVHCFRERGGTRQGFRSRRNRHPSNPFYDCSSHLLRSIQVDDTIVCWCTLWKVAMSKHLDKSQSPPTSPSLPSEECFPYENDDLMLRAYESEKWFWWKFIGYTYGLISLWKMPFLCMWSIAFSTWYM